MQEVYDQAALRHFKDAQYLEKDERLANADQLYGFAAECAIKLVWPLSPRIPHIHINDLWDQVHLQKMVRPYPSLYEILRKTNPFANWSASQRYEKDNFVSKKSLAIHRDTAKRILGSVGIL